MSGPNLADTVVEYLSSQDVRNIFGVLAHTSFAFGDAIAKRPQMRFVNAQHEGGAGNMALGYARATKQPAVCLVSAGGGATNIVTAVAQAYKESVPLFVISSDIGTASSAKGHWASLHGMEHVRLFQPITKQSAKLERSRRARLGARFAVSSDHARTPGTGVFLIVPEDLQHAHLPEPLSFAPTAEPVAPAMDAGAAKPPWICCSRRNAPVVLAGTGVDWARRARRSARAGRIVIAAGRSQLYGQRRFSGKSSARARLPRLRQPALRAEIFSGGRFDSRRRHDLQRRHDPAASATRSFPENAKIIQIDTDPDQLGRNYPTALSIQADAKIALRAIIDGVKSRQPKAAANGARAKRSKQAKQAWKNDVERKNRQARFDLRIRAESSQRAAHRQ